MKDLQNNMEFKIAVSNPNESVFSLKKENADFSNNQVVLNAVIGTLVKYSPTGRLEPYLAESWNVSSDNKLWTFKFREGMSAENGDIINASSFIEILKKNLKTYSASGSVIIFDDLIGWSDFIIGKTDCPKGLSVNNNSINFEFNSTPDSFLEILRMPYFGFWLEKETLISSGPYSIKTILPNKIILSLRNDWFTVSEESTKEVTISFTSLNLPKEDIYESTITRFPYYTEADKNLKNGYWIMSPPTILENFTLSPTKPNFFNNKHNRIVFNNRIMSQYSKMVKADFFYPSAKSVIKKDLDTQEYQKNSLETSLTFALERSNYSSKELDNLKELITFALHGSGVKFEIIERNLQDKEWFKKTDSNNFFDARISAVEIGASPLYSAIKMMFCTKLGINFPDPSGKICELVNKGIITSRDIDKSFIDQFNQILYDDSVIIPIQHQSSKWFVSNIINPKSLPPITLYPQFELIRRR